MMMDKDEMIKSWINEICNQIPMYFKDESKLKDNLEYFVIFSNIEWYNIALLYYQKPDISFVMCKDNWDDLLPEGKTFYIKKGQRGLRIILPYVKDNHLVYRDAVVWDISQADSPPEFCHVSNLKLTVESIDMAILEKMDVDTIIQYVIKSYHDIIPEENKDFIYNCIHYILSLYMYGSSNENLTLDGVTGLSDDKCIELYALLAYIIKKLHVRLKNYYDDLTARFQQIKLREHAEKVSRMNIKERITEAEETIKRLNIEKIKENDEEFDVYDVDI